MHWTIKLLIFGYAFGYGWQLVRLLTTAKVSPHWLAYVAAPFVALVWPLCLSMHFWNSWLAGRAERRREAEDMEIWP